MIIKEELSNSVEKTSDDDTKINRLETATPFNPSRQKEFITVDSECDYLEERKV